MPLGPQSPMNIANKEVEVLRYLAGGGRIYSNLNIKLHMFFFFFFNFYYLFIILFLAVLGLRFCARAFSSCGERGPLFIAVRGPLTLAASLVAEHGLSCCRAWAPDAQAQ